MKVKDIKRTMRDDYHYKEVPPYTLIRVEDAQERIKLAKELISKIEEDWDKLKNYKPAEALL